MSGTLVLVMGALAFGSSVAAQEDLYAVTSKDQGIVEFVDLTVTEIKREARKSVLLVPGFHQRSAAGSRWLMCAYTDLAIRRGFKYWLVVYPAETSETVVVGFPTSDTEDVGKTLGREFVGERVLPRAPASVDVMATRVCGVKPERMGMEPWVQPVRPGWVRPRTSDGELARDYKECVGAATGEVSEARALFVLWSCMTAKRYVMTPAEGLAPWKKGRATDSDRVHDFAECARQFTSFSQWYPKATVELFECMRNKGYDWTGRWTVR